MIVSKDDVFGPLGLNRHAEGVDYHTPTVRGDDVRLVAGLSREHRVDGFERR